MVYDVDVNRVNRVCKLLRCYLKHVQNSVFEGEISPKRLSNLLSRLRSIVDKEKDHIVVYSFPSKKVVKKVEFGEGRWIGNVL